MPKPHQRPARLSDDTTPSPTLSSSTTTDEKIERVSFAIDADGAIAADQLRPATRDKLRRAFSTTAGREIVLGSTAPGATAITAENAALAAVLYDSLGALFVSAFKASGYAIDQAEMMRYSEQEKAALIPATAKVFAKYVTDFKYADELALAVLFVSITGSKIGTLKKPAKVLPFDASQPETPAS